ncbi:MAG: YfcE family phosphodiesterase [Chlamydiae bacterium]|nr:MAG: YfcE family phosphodiesterase [Chlamydiota bacterium]
MKIGVMSDSHDRMTMIRSAVAVFKEYGVEMIIHAGDFISPITFEYMKDIDVPFIGVFGNNDGEKFFLKKRYKNIGELHERCFKGKIDELKFIVLHENDLVDSLAKSGDYDVVVYGHTHEIDVRKIGKTLIINPGEVCGWCTGKYTVAVLDSKTMDVEIIDIC